MSIQAVSARYEFRIFGQRFNFWHQRMARLSEPVPEKFWSRQSSEVYLLSPRDQRHNVKLRNGMLDIKVLLKQENSLDQWDVASKTALTKGVKEIQPLLQQALAYGDLSLNEDALDELSLVAAVNDHPELLAVRVSKVRQGYRIGNCLCEYAEVLINDAKVYSLAVEAEDPVDIRNTIKQISLPEHDNISYPEAIRRIIGWRSDQLVYGEG